MTLRLDGITAGYGLAQVVTDVSFDVGPAEVVTVFGPSGSGKTTLLRVVAGLHPARAGTITYDTHDLTAVEPQRRGIGLVPQEMALFPHLSVAENIGYGIARKHPLFAARSQRVAELLELIGLSDRATARPHELSGGQQQRVSVARALAPKPRVLLLDEPFSSLDEGLRDQLRADTIDLLRITGTPAILITHDMAEALSLSDRLVVLDRGSVLAVDAPRRLYEEPVSSRVARLLGPCLVVAAQPQGGLMATALGQLQPRATVPSGPVDALVRPEQVCLLRESTSDTVAGQVVRVSYQGHTQVVQVSLPSGDVVPARVPAHESWTVGEGVGIRVDGPVAVVPATDGSAT